MYVLYLCSFPAPLPVLGIVGEPPHVPVGLDDFGPQDVVLLILPYSHRLQAAVELKSLRAELQHLRKVEEERWQWRWRGQTKGREGRKKGKEQKRNGEKGRQTYRTGRERGEEGFEVDEERKEREIGNKWRDRGGGSREKCKRRSKWSGEK